MRDLTAQEQHVLDALGDAYNVAAVLPVIHDSDLPEIVQAIHVAQNIVMARPAAEADRFRKRP